MLVVIVLLKINLNYLVNRMLNERWLNDRDIMVIF